MLRLSSGAVALALISASALPSSAGPSQLTASGEMNSEAFSWAKRRPIAPRNRTRAFPAQRLVSNPDMRASPSMGGRSRRGGGRVNGSMGRR
jgi:hypothetical protein